MSRYVCVRIPRMDNVDIGLFDYDRYNTLYFFILNADEQIYLRYGGRDTSQDTFLNLDSLALALGKGLELHEQYQKGELKKTVRPQPKYPREIPLLVERTFARNNCVECHLIGDFTLQHKELDGTLDKAQDMFRSADVRVVGIQLDIPKGLVVREASGPAAEAGMRAGDTIASVNGTAVWTFGDLQYYYDKIPRAATSVEFTVVRGGKTVALKIALPRLWWFTDIRYKQLTIDPRTYFETRALTAEEKKERRLDPDGFAGQVKYVGNMAQMLGLHDLKVGDVITAVNGVAKDESANTPEFYIRLRVKAGDSVKLDLLREGKVMQMELKTSRLSFRK